jgi:hypothetical protein
MKERIKHYILIAAAVAALYFVLDNHFIMDGHRVHLLKKTRLSCGKRALEIFSWSWE